MYSLVLLTSGAGLTKEIVINGPAGILNCASLTLLPGNADDTEARLHLMMVALSM